MLTPGIAVGYWNARNRPALARSSGARRQDALPVQQDIAARHLVVRVAGDGVGQRALAGAVRPHQRMHFALADGQVDALQDRLAFDGACRSLITSSVGMDVYLLSSTRSFPGRREASACPQDRSFAPTIRALRHGIGVLCSRFPATISARASASIGVTETIRRQAFFPAGLQAEPTVSSSVVGLTQYRVDAGRLPVGDRDVLLRAVSPLRPMPVRRQAQPDHLLVLFRRSVGFLHQIPGSVIAFRGK